MGLEGGKGVGGWGKFFFIPKFKQIWCVNYSHEWHMQRHNFFGPRPLGALGRGPKGQISLKFSNIFKPNFVFSQMQDIKLIRRYFHSFALVMPQGSDLGVQGGGVGDQKLF